MLRKVALILAMVGYGATVPALALGTSNEAIPVSPDNFVRAETDLYFKDIATKRGGFGKFLIDRTLTPVDKQTVVRQNRDTLYAGVVVDLAAGPVTITLPDAGKRYLAMQVINEDEYTPQVVYTPGPHTFTQQQVGSRYALFAIRILVAPQDPEDVRQVHALQDALRLDQPGGPGKLDFPQWDPVSQEKVRTALLTLATTLPDMKRAFGSREEVDPVRRLIGAAAAWGGNPDKDAIYLDVVPKKNDGKTVYRLTTNDVPVDGFWSISLYNAAGYFQKNPFDSYSLNSVTAKRDANGAITVQFGGCDGNVPNCLPIMEGWNYMVRLYRPRSELLDGSWTFPAAQPVN